MASMLLLLMVIILLVTLLSGFPVAFVLAGISLIFAWIGHFAGVFDISLFSALGPRIYGIMRNDLLIAVPLFVFMGVALERAGIAEELLTSMEAAFGKIKSGLGLSVVLVGVLLAASTGIVGATVVTMGLISLPTMLKRGYSAELSTGTICAAGTLGQIIPPSIILILLGDQISGAHQNAQMALGNMAPTPISISDLFVAALLPGLLLVFLYSLWVMFKRLREPACTMEAATASTTFATFLRNLCPPLLLILLVLGTILGGIATATEAAAMGALGALILIVLKGRFCLKALGDIARSTMETTSMVFTILIGATVFSLVFRGFGGDNILHHLLSQLPGGMISVLLLTMLVMFFLGFILDFIEITFVVVPIIAPILLTMGADPIWLAILIALNLQTSFLTPPFGFSLFYLRGVAPKEIATGAIYRGVIPFVIIQLIVMLMVVNFSGLATYLPKRFYGTEATNPLTQSDAAVTIESDYDIDF